MRNEVWAARDREVLVEGPAGTGKTFQILVYLYLVADKYPGCRIAIVRKSRSSMTQTVLATLDNKVIPPYGNVRFHGSRQEYQFPNGSVIVVGGMDKASKILSAEYDVIYACEGTELFEGDWETMLTRLRNGVVPYQRAIIDCNPADAQHWLNLRADTPLMKRVATTHEDNPYYWDFDKDCYTAAGEQYVLGMLEQLTGVRYLRYRKGLWARAEGQVYDYLPTVHFLHAAG